MKRVWMLGIALTTLVGTPAVAQFWDKLTNPEVLVSITHPPGLGLQLKKIAFGPAQGQCSDQFIDSLVQLFVDNQVEVIDRQHLDSILAEHRFNLSGYVDPQSAAALGKILGPSALVFVKVSRCETKQEHLYENVKDYRGIIHTNYISRTKASFKASLQTVDLATGKIFSARTIDASPQDQNVAEGGYPEFPDENAMLDHAMAQAKAEIHRMFFPWNESVKLTYYNDKDCGMKQAYELLKRGEKDGALQQSLTDLDSCKANSAIKPKVLGRAYYNAGMSYFTVNDFDHALEMLNQAAQLHPGNIVNDAIAGCNHAKGLAADMQRFEQRVQLEASKTAAPAESSGGSQATPGPDQGSAAAGDTTKSQASPEERLKKLNSLFKRGLISKEDYEQKKAEILKEL